MNSLDPTLSLEPFSDEEDQLLQKLINKYGVGHWAQMAVWFPGRTDANLLMRWKNRKFSGKLK